MGMFSVVLINHRVTSITLQLSTAYRHYDRRQHRVHIVAITAAGSDAVRAGHGTTPAISHRQ